jgi:hypothetical protein
MGSFDDLLDEIREAGLSDDLLGRLKSATAASPIRAERDEWKTKAEQAAAEARELRAAVMSTTFKDAGISINPAALNLPADLDFRNVEAVREWGSTMGLVSTQSTPPLTPPSEQQGARSFHAPDAGAGEPDLDATKMAEMAALRDKIYSHGRPPNMQDVYAAARAAGWEDTRGR